jgi:hypothetical protein
MTCARRSTAASLALRRLSGRVFSQAEAWLKRGLPAPPITVVASTLVARTAAVSAVRRGVGRICMPRIMVALVVVALVDLARLTLGAG